MLTWIIDTGALVAFFDRGDAAHEDVRDCLGNFSGRLCTTGAVIGEVMHFLPDVLDGPERLSEFVLSSGIDIFDCTQPLQIQSAVALMKRYRDTPMDFADATLVCLAEELETLDILTLDRRGFRTYRTAARKSFNLLLS